MHGVKRGARLSAEQQRQEVERNTFLANLIRRALIVRNTPVPTPLDNQFDASYRIIERALEANPDEYTLWSFRREVLIARHNELVSLDQYFREELELTTRALKRHPKAYAAWHHRLWLLENGHSTLGVDRDIVDQAIKQEKQLSAYMLSKDGRNFHGWAHRMRVRAIVKTQSPEQRTAESKNELAFVHSKINEDFANYSAWHHRSVLLPRIHKKTADAFLADELQLVRQAFYTEPDVQSAWFYHRWLLAGAPAKGGKATVQPVLLEDELAACEELLSIEPEARYALQAKVHILIQLRRGDDAHGALDTLKKIDPMRTGYYNHLREKAQGSVRTN